MSVGKKGVRPSTSVLFVIPNTFIYVIYCCKHTRLHTDLAAADATSTMLTRDSVAVFTCHGIVLLFQRSGVDDAPEEASVADSVLLPLVALVQQLVMQEKQLAAQRVKLIQRS